MDALSDSDRGFLRTVIDLNTNPGNMINDYIDGKRQRYLSPGKYAFFLIVIFTVNISYLEHHFGFFESLTKGAQALSTKVHDSDSKNKKIKISENIKTATNKNSWGIFNIPESNEIYLNFSLFGMSVDRKISNEQAILFLRDLLPHYHKTLFDSLKFFIILWIPIFSLFSYFIFFRHPFNFAEHVTVNSYIYAHLLLIFTALSPIYWLSSGLIVTTLVTTFLASSLYLIYSYMQIFSQGRYRIVKTLFSIGAAFSTYTTILCALIIIQALYIALLNIDKLQ